MQKKAYFFLSIFLFGVFLFLGLDRAFHYSPSGFYPYKVTFSHSKSSEWDLPPLSTGAKIELDTALSQKFTYYDKGSQAYVFISEDKQYILKFFKQHKLRPKTWVAYFPFPFNPYYQDYLFKKRKAAATFSACKTAFLELKEQTGLLYVHLNPSLDCDKELVVFDKRGNRHVIQLNEMSFYLQKRAHLIYPRLSELMRQGEIERAKQVISSLFTLLEFLGKKGIVDNDPILRKNFGLIDDTAVQIDIGRLRIDPTRVDTKAYTQEIGSITHSFQLWLEKNYPQLSPHFAECLKKSTS